MKPNDLVEDGRAVRMEVRLPVMILTAALAVLSACGSFDEKESTVDPFRDDATTADPFHDAAQARDAASSDDAGDAADSEGTEGCEACPAGFVCSTDVCTVRPTSVWSVSAWNAEIEPRTPTNAPWDGVYGGPDGGLISSNPPDPRACMDLKDGLPLKCTASVTDTLAPTWREDLARMTASSLMDSFPISLQDDDGAAPADTICSVTTHIASDDFLRGSLDVACSKSRVVFHLVWISDN